MHFCVLNCLCDGVSVIDIQQTLLTDRPTLSAVLSVFRSQRLPLKTKGGATVDLKPWGFTDPSQVGLVCR